MPPVLDVETFFLSHDVPAANVSDEMCILGHVFMFLVPLSSDLYMPKKETTLTRLLPLFAVMLAYPYAFLWKG